MMSGRLNKKIALITGTGNGQGRAAALRFAAEGASVVGCDTDVARAVETVDIVKKNGGVMHSVQPVDAGSETDVNRWVAEAVEHFGPFDIVYNNAAGARHAPISELSIEDFEWTMHNEVSIILIAVKAALPVFKQRGGGVVINIGSTAGNYGAGWPRNAIGMLPHCVGKAAVIRMTQVMAIELSPYNVRVNCISPGVIVTPGIAPLLRTPGVQESFQDLNLISRLGVPDDIAAAAVYLASDEAAYVTGVNLLVDGGQVAGAGHGQPDDATSEMIKEASRARVESPQE
jgi:meso-butanediol dehydrogenase / (S,S)-butanediol dehydrogenase / diacetyl reductase